MLLCQHGLTRYGMCAEADTHTGSLPHTLTPDQHRFRTGQHLSKTMALQQAVSRCSVALAGASSRLCESCERQGRERRGAPRPQRNHPTSASSKPRCMLCARSLQRRSAVCGSGGRSGVECPGAVAVSAATAPLILTARHADLRVTWLRPRPLSKPTLCPWPCAGGVSGGHEEELAGRAPVRAAAPWLQPQGALVRVGVMWLVCHTMQHSQAWP